MSGLRDAIAQHQAGLAELTRAASDSKAWNDDQRHALDGQFVDPLLQDGKALVRALYTAAHEIAAAQQMLQR